MAPNPPLSRRRQFQLVLESMLTGGKVYFQPPGNVKLSYPCIIYHTYRYDTSHADNILYRAQRAYTVMYIDTNPDATFPETYLKTQPMTHFDREYTADNLHHWVFTTYY